MSNNFTEEMPRSAFGELSVIEPTPIVQATAQYGLHGKLFTFKTPGATVLAEDSLFKCNSGSSPISTATITSRRRVNYRAGQGIDARITAVFATGLADSLQVAGMISATDVVGFGYQGAEFGIIHGKGGIVEIQELTITSAAAVAESATVTINGTPYSVPLSAGAVQDNAYEIAVSLNAQVEGYDFTSNNDQVVAAALLAAPQGSFAFTGATATGAWVQMAAGKLRVDDFTPQADWNENTFDDLEPAKGNVYQVKYQYLGFGGIDLLVENPETSRFELAHRIKYSNSSVIPSATDPIFRIGWAVQNSGNTTPIELSGGSLAGFIEGKVIIQPGSRAADNVVASVPTAGQTNLISVRNRLVFGNKRNRTETRPLTLTVSTDSAKGAIIQIFRNSTFASPVDFKYLDKNNSTTEIAKNAVIVDGTDSQLIGSFATTQAGDIINMDELSAIILADDTLSFTGRTASGSASDINISISVREDF